MNPPTARRSLSSILLTADRALDGDDDTGATPPLHQAVAHRARDAAHLAEIAQPMGDRYYTRRGNPTASRLARVIADLEGAEAGLITASGMGALATAVLSLVKAGDHVVGQSAHYIGSNQILDRLLPGFGVATTRVDQRDPEAYAQALRPNTRLVLLESPVNPLMHLTDLAQVAALARARGIVTLCDNTFATPLNQRPIEHGIDLVMHSVTKALGGHHDLLAGALVGPRTLIEQIWEGSLTLGAIGAPFNAWLALRGLRTLELRVARQNANGAALAAMLQAHPAIERVHYPGLPDHPQRALVQRQMSGHGGIVTFEVGGGAVPAQRFLERLRSVGLHSSLGGVTANAVRPAALFGEQLPAEVVASQGITPGMIRLSVGIEATADLLDDVRHALA